MIELSLHNVTQISDYVLYINWDNLDKVFYYKDFDKIWRLNISIFQAFKELRSLNLSFNEIGGWIENEGMFESCFFFFFFSSFIHVLFVWYG